MATGGRAGWVTAGARLAAVAVAYFLSAELGLRLGLVGDIVTPLWPPTGVAVVAAAALGLRVWPAIAVAAFAVNAGLAASPTVAAGIAAGNTLAPLAAAILLRRLGFDDRLARLRDAVVLVLVALLTMSISASVGTAVVHLGDGPADAVRDTWWVWWAGDAMGVLIVAPVLWSLGHVRPGPPDWSRIAEGGLLLSGLTLAAFAAAGTEDALFFVLLPALGWIAWRFQQLGAAPAGLVVSTVVTLAAVEERGVFAGDPLLQQMVVLQTFNASVALTSFVFAAAFTERRHMLESLYEREHRVAETLQRSMLPDHLPVIDHVALCARYIPSSEEAAVGGDWYDVLRLPDGTIGLVIGDVVGHGVAAAATMAHLRAGVRAYSLDRGDPAATLRAVNRMAMDLEAEMMATLLYAEFDPRSRRLRFTTAGHPPPLLVSPDGNPSFLEGGLTPPIGVTRDFDGTVATYCVAPGATLILFTDGLVERRTEDLRVSLDRLLIVAARAAAEAELEEMCDTLLAGVSAEDTTDDIALLALRDRPPD